MDLTLINSPLQDYTVNKKKDYDTIPPLGLGYLATVAKKAGLDVKLLDAEALGLSPEEITEHAKDSKIIGINLLSPTVYLTKKICSSLKKYGAKIIAGGPHTTIYPSQSLNQIPEIDILVRGEGEQTLEELIKSDWQQHGIKGVSYRKENAIIHNMPREHLQNIDEFPFIDRNFFVNDPHIDNGKITSTVLTSRGCPYSCTYCAGSTVSGKAIRQRSAKNIVDELEELNKAHGINRIHFIDNNFVYSKDKILDFTEEFAKRNLGIEWRALVRTDTIARKLDKAVLQKMKENGCYLLTFGFESGSQRILNMIKKGSTLEDARIAVKQCKEVGISTKGHFMFGFPTETVGEMEMTLQHAADLGIDTAYFSLVKAYPGTELYKNLAQARDEKDLLDYVHFQDAIDKENLTDDEKSILTELAKRGMNFNRVIKYNIANRNPISTVSFSRLIGVLKHAYKKFYFGNFYKPREQELEYESVCGL